MTRHHDLKATDPLPLRALDPAGRMRQLAIESIARDEGCSLDEAALRLDSTPATPVESAEDVAARRREHEARRVERALAELGIPVRGAMLGAVARADVKPTLPTHEVAQWLRAEHQRVLVLIGDMGLGKTIAGALALAAWVRRRRSVAYVREPQLVRWSHSTTLAHEARVEALRTADMLVVDELGTSPTKDAERVRDAVFAIVDDRLAGERRTVLIGNLRREDVATRYGARFADRLAEVGRIAHVTGPSLRTQAGTPRDGA